MKPIRRWPSEIRCSTSCRAPPKLSPRTTSDSMPETVRSISTNGTPNFASRRRLLFERSLTGAITIPSTRWAIISSITSRSTSRSARVSQRRTRKPARRATSSAPRTIRVKNGFATSGTINASVPVRCRLSPLREPARDVAELRDRLLDAPARLGADPLAGVDHTRDRHGRDVCQPRDVLDRDRGCVGSHRFVGISTTIRRKFCLYRRLKRLDCGSGSVLSVPQSPP